MSSDTDIERLIEALQQDGPSDRDAARLRARLAAIGVAAAVGVAQGTAAASMPAAKAAASTGVGLSTRWASLSLLPKMGIVVVAASALGGPLVAVQMHGGMTAAERPVSAATPQAHDGARAAAPRILEPVPAQFEGVATLPDRAPRLESRAGRTPVRAAHAVVAVPSPAAVAAGENAPAGAPVVTAAGAQALVATATSDMAGSSDATARFAENPTPASAPVAPRASSLAEETALIDAAFAALRAQDAGTAAALVAEHARRFPRGLLWRERERARQKLVLIRRK